MNVFMTQALRNRFGKVGVDADFFIECFEEFKRKPLDHDDIFGWENTYVAPAVNGIAHILRHVHMRPVDPAEREEWDRLARKKAHKTSDRALVFVTNARGDHLLIGILEEPDAHEIAKMKTQQHRDLMKSYAQVAAEFVLTGQTSY